MRCFKLVTAILLAANAILVNSKVTFKVIAVSGTPYVVVNKKKYSMKVEEYPIYSVTVNDVNAPVEYHYILGSEEEKFTRTADSDTTLNDFFNRSVTVKKHPLFPMAYETYSTLKKSKLYDDTFVATFLIEGKKSEIDYLHSHPNEEKKFNCTITYVSPYGIKVFQNGGIKISGQSTKYNKKLSYKISGLKLDNDKELYSRTGLKLRGEYGDPSFLREKTYFDMLNSLGVPTSQSKFARLYINKTPVGLFLVTDDFSNKHFLKSVFNKGKKFEAENAIIKVNSGGDLSYKGTSKDVLEPYSYKGDNEAAKDSSSKGLQKIKELLVPFLKDADNYPTKKKLNFDIKAFLRAMALEYLAHGTDNYWMVQGNYFMFRNNATEQWHFIDSDFDMTFGHGSPDKCLSTTLDNYVLVKNKGDSRPFIDNIRKVKENDDYLKSAVKRLVQTAFNINAAGPRIESFAELIKEDAKWDFGLKRMNTYSGDHEVKDKPHTISDFERETGKTSTSYPWAIQKWILDRSKKVASIYKFDIPSMPLSDLGYFEPEYEDKKDKDKDKDKTTTIATTTTTTTTTTVNTLPTANAGAKCGKNIAICKEGLCCSKNGVCGSTTAYCGLGCQSEFGKCLPVAGSREKCGANVAVCQEGLCCSKYNSCGSTSNYCGIGCQSEFGKCLPVVGSREKCGANVAVCQEGLCCSKYNSCGSTSNYCGVGCQSEFGKCNPVTTTTTKKTSVTTTTKTTIVTNLPTSNGKCGPGIAVCVEGYCCSKYGYCGKTPDYCGNGCQSGYGKCDPSLITTTTTTTKKTTKITRKTTKTTKKVTTTKKSSSSNSGKCGSVYGSCPSGYCCSKYGYCGKSDMYCSTGCNKSYGTCW
ncbi:coth-domain-containing protein [Anaeromyces robustus]|uniref:Coth-domain-containing protein n=1 Tax=Anaeromyces robustus TaxID=1754192 RepID=A0A1Y1XJB3_9FUNG|nr:coth-domain-containing protein [Anaeromyces robustus]|eukprot:ORX85849.1 coth-domain-containing protein [Anaeromyces robustus]